MTATGTPNLPTPRFSKPPVAELVLGVQFTPLGSLNSVQVAAWRERIKGEFPTVQEHSELPDLFEEPDLDLVRVRMQMTVGVPPRRFWFVNAAETELIQIQRNRFVYNWRKRNDADQYPSYKDIRAKVEKQLSAFLEFVAAERLGEFTPDLCEVTYINHIASGGVWASHGEASKVFSVLSGKQTGDFLPSAEMMGFAATYRLPTDGAEMVGRLRVQAEPSFFVADKAPLFRMSVSARVPVVGANVAGVLNAMDLGHVWGTCGFAALTTKQMHEAWGKEE